jgi:hypothetical protein
MVNAQAFNTLHRIFKGSSPQNGMPHIFQTYNTISSLSTPLNQVHTVQVHLRP